MWFQIRLCFLRSVITIFTFFVIYISLLKTMILVTGWSSVCSGQTISLTTGRLEIFKLGGRATKNLI